jgi:hypothetical protein
LTGDRHRRRGAADPPIGTAARPRGEVPRPSRTTILRRQGSARRRGRAYQPRPHVGNCSDSPSSASQMRASSGRSPRPLPEAKGTGPLDGAGGETLRPDPSMRGPFELRVIHRVPPLLSTCVPTCNRAQPLRRLLNCLVTERRRLEADVEIVISDNCSADDTPPVVESAQQWGPMVHQMAGNRAGIRPAYQRLARGARADAGMVARDRRSIFTRCDVAL